MERRGRLVSRLPGPLVLPVNVQLTNGIVWLGAFFEPNDVAVNDGAKFKATE